MAPDHRSEPITLEADGFRLNGRLHLPSGPRHPVVVGSHGLFSDGNSPKQIELAERCVAAGIAYCRFDHRGCGASSGRFETATSLEGRCRDLEAVVGLLRERSDIADAVGLFGSSLGGAVCLAAARRLGAGRIVTVAAPIDSRAVLAGDADGCGGPDLPSVFRRPALQFDLREEVAGIRNLLVFHGDRDETIPVDQGLTLYELAGRPKRIVIHEGGDHRMSLRAHQLRFMEEAVGWYLPLKASAR